MARVAIQNSPLTVLRVVGNRNTEPHRDWARAEAQMIRPTSIGVLRYPFKLARYGSEGFGRYGETR